MSKKAIIYKVLHTNGGYQIQAFMPRYMPAGDRTKILDWFQSYRVEVHRQNPYWLTVFHAGDHAYFLDIVPGETPKDLIVNAFDPANTWKQTSFEYA